MKWLPVFAVSVLVGCAEVRIMDVDFVSNEVVVINGKRFPLRSRSDGCEVRKRFPAAEQLIFRNIRNCRFSSMWRLVDYKASDRDEDAARIGVIFYYYIVLSDGSSHPVKWYGRYSDHAYLAGPSSERCLDVKCSSFSGSFSESEVENSYLHLWCNFDETTGAELLNVVEKYCAAGGGDNDIYLMPY